REIEAHGTGTRDVPETESFVISEGLFDRLVERVVYGASRQAIPAAAPRDVSPYGEKLQRQTKVRAGKGRPVGRHGRVDHERITHALGRAADAEVPGRCVEGSRAVDGAGVEASAAGDQLRATRAELYLTAYRVGLYEPASTGIDVGAGGRGSGQDRKSTRLNSSH